MVRENLLGMMDQRMKVNFKKELFQEKEFF